MKTFKDSEAAEWQIAINYGAIKRVKGLIPDANLAGYADAAGSALPLCTRLQVDIEFFCNVLYALVKPQADERKISDEDFGRRLGGEAIFAARAAFFEEWAEFFRQLHQADAVAAIEKQAAVMEQATAMTAEKIEAIDVKSLLAQTSSASAADSPESSASTPISAHFENSSGWPKAV